METWERPTKIHKNNVRDFSRTILIVTSPKLSGVNIPYNDAFDEIDKMLSSLYKEFNKIVEQACTYGNRFLYSNAELKKTEIIIAIRT